MGIPRMPAELAFFGPYVEATRAQLDDAAWETSWSEGSAMNMEEAIEYGLSEEEPAHATSSEERSTDTQAPTLTRREEEVAALVAQGMTNRSIASELSISEHTVANHVTKILRKLTLGSRSQLTAWVVEQRILP